MSSFRDLQSSIRRHGAPVTVVLIALIVLSFLGQYMQALSPEVFALLTPDAMLKPWTLLLWPLSFPGLGGHFLGVVFGSLWLWSLGGLVEREMKSRRFAIMVVGFTALMGAMAVVGSLVTRTPGILAAPYPVIALVTVIWGTRYPNHEVKFMFVLCLAAKWVAWISAGLVFFSIPAQLAPFVILPLALAHFFAAGKLGIPYSGAYAAKKKADAPTYGRTGKVDGKFLDDVNQRAKEREERERLRKLFESSMIDNTGEDDRDAR